MTINEFIIISNNFKMSYGSNVNKWDNDVYNEYWHIKRQILSKTSLTNEEFNLICVARKYNLLTKLINQINVLNEAHEQAKNIGVQYGK